jgi:hypothetical protein
MSNGILTRIRMSFFSEPIKISELLNHFPSKKNTLVVVAFERTNESSDDLECSRSRLSYAAKKHQREAGTREVARKRSRSMAMDKVI